jgi:hypothetical protein
MFERITHSNEIIGLTMMLLLVMALVASQADATIREDVGAATAMEQAEGLDSPGMPFTATIEGHFNGKVLTVSIDTMAHFGRFRIQGK